VADIVLPYSNDEDGVAKYLSQLKYDWLDFIHKKIIFLTYTRYNLINISVRIDNE
jgi:hypothetical protein